MCSGQFKCYKVGAIYCYTEISIYYLINLLHPLHHTE